MESRNNDLLADFNSQREVVILKLRIAAIEATMDTRTLDLYKEQFEALVKTDSELKYLDNAINDIKDELHTGRLKPISD